MPAAYRCIFFIIDNSSIRVIRRFRPGAAAAAFDRFRPRARNNVRSGSRRRSRWVLTVVLRGNELLTRAVTAFVPRPDRAGRFRRGLVHRYSGRHPGRSTHEPRTSYGATSCAARGLVAPVDRRPHSRMGVWDRRRARSSNARPRFVARDANFIQCGETKGNANHTWTDSRVRRRDRRAFTHATRRLVAAPRGLGSVLRSRRASSGRFISCAPAPHGSNHALTTVDGRACSMQHA